MLLALLELPDQLLEVALVRLLHRRQLLEELLHARLRGLRRGALVEGDGVVLGDRGVTHDLRETQLLHVRSFARVLTHHCSSATDEPRQCADASPGGRPSPVTASELPTSSVKYCQENHGRAGVL